MNTTTVTTINLTAKDLKKNYITSAMDILTDLLENSDIEMFEAQLSMIQDVLVEIKNDGFKDLFKDGHTALLLSSKDLEDVESFTPAEDKKLQLIISHIGQDDEVIELEDIVL